MNKVVGIVKNIGLVIVTGLAAGVLTDVLVTFGINDKNPGLFQLMAGTLAIAWIVLFVLANAEK